jgi:2-polyprenyl-6-hydroxyphenyl methylase/3-demethylubiquinone-9 3-methyltransferase
VQAIAQLIKPEGHIFFSTINRTPQAFLGVIVGAEYCLKLLPKGTHHYAQFIKPSELDAILREHQLSLKALSGLTYRPFTQRAFLSASPAINYLAYATPRFI